MPRYGGRQRFSGVNIGITSTIVGFVRGLGAIGFIIKVWGGSNGANNLSEMVGRPSHDGAISTSSTLVLQASGELLTNGAEAAANAIYMPSNPITGGLITPWPTEWIRLEATMLTAASNGCTVDVWPVYGEDFDQQASQLPT